MSGCLAPEVAVPADGTLTVADATIHRPTLCGPAATVADARTIFSDDHVQAVLVVDGGTLVAVVERNDLAGATPDAPALGVGCLTGRTVEAHADLDHTWRLMTAGRRRRLAVVDRQGILLGLLCLKRSGKGFCTDADVAARAAERLAARHAPAGCGGDWGAAGAG
jgi:hypothetical protein